MLTNATRMVLLTNYVGLGGLCTGGWRNWGRGGGRRVRTLRAPFSRKCPARMPAAGVSSAVVSAKVERIGIGRSWEAIVMADVVLFLADATARPSDEDAEAVDLVKKLHAPVIAVLNKVDKVQPKQKLLDVIARYQQMHEFAAFVPVSALKGEGLDVLKKEIISRLPAGPAMYPEDYLTDQPERFLAAEIIREKVVHHTQQEVPHAVAVAIDAFTNTGVNTFSLTDTAAALAAAPALVADQATRTCWARSTSACSRRTTGRSGPRWRTAPVADRHRPRKGGPLWT